MKYVLREAFLDDKNQKNAGNKARQDADTILTDLGYAPLDYQVGDWLAMSFVQAQRHKARQLSQALAQLVAGDELVIQFPMIHHSFFLTHLLKQLNRKGVKTCFLIHDLETLRYAKDKSRSLKQRLKIRLLEGAPLRAVTGIIAHNDCMADFLTSRGLAEDKIQSLEIFDYLMPVGVNDQSLAKESPIMVAGNLSPEKAGYLYDMPDQPQINLYGLGFDQDRCASNETYFGAFLPDELPQHLAGSFGLVWDGGSSETCSGIYGDYLRYNNSHKASLYLAAGFPLVVWQESALAKFVQIQQCGMAVASLHELEGRLAQLSEQDYQNLVTNARKLGAQLRKGHFLAQALQRFSQS